MSDKKINFYFKKYVFISLIPARVGSVSLRNKNLKKIKNKSLVEYAIIASKKSKFINKTFLSSDSEKILKIGKKYDILQVKRPKKFASNSSVANDVVNHFSKLLKNQINDKKIIIIYLQPTSPLRTYFHINKAIELFIKKKSKSLISVTKIKFSIYKSLMINKYGLIKSIFNENLVTSNRQDFNEVYRPNGAIYIFKLSDFLKKKKIPIKNSTPFIMKEDESLEIDNLLDLKIIKKKLKKKNFY